MRNFKYADLTKYKNSSIIVFYGESLNLLFLNNFLQESIVKDSKDGSNEIRSFNPSINSLVLDSTGVRGFGSIHLNEGHLIITNSIGKGDWLSSDSDLKKLRSLALEYGLLVEGYYYKRDVVKIYNYFSTIEKPREFNTEEGFFTYYLPNIMFTGKVLRKDLLKVLSKMDNAHSRFMTKNDYDLMKLIRENAI